MLLREEIVTKERKTDLDKLGIAKTAREEKIRARDAKLADEAEQQKMARFFIASTF